MNLAELSAGPDGLTEIARLAEAETKRLRKIAGGLTPANLGPGLMITEKMREQQEQLERAFKSVVSNVMPAGVDKFAASLRKQQEAARKALGSPLSDIAEAARKSNRLWEDLAKSRDEIREMLAPPITPEIEYPPPILPDLRFHIQDDRREAERRLAEHAAELKRELEAYLSPLPPQAWSLLEHLESCPEGLAPEREIPEELRDPDLTRVCCYFKLVASHCVRVVSRHHSHDSGVKLGITELGLTVLSIRRLSPSPHRAVAHALGQEGRTLDDTNPASEVDGACEVEENNGNDFRQPSPQGVLADHRPKPSNTDGGDSQDGGLVPPIGGDNDLPPSSRGAKRRLPPPKQQIVDAVLKRLQDDDRETVSRSDLRAIGLPPQSVDNHWERTGRDSNCRRGGGTYLDEVSYSRDFVIAYVRDSWNPRLKSKGRPSQASQTSEDQSEGSDEAVEVA